MIPDLVKRIAISTGIVVLVAAPCIMVYDRAASVAFAVTTLWMIANLLVWTVLMKAALKPDSESRDALVILLAVMAKLVLLGVGIGALIICAPYTAAQIWAITAGVSSIALIAALKAIGARITAQQHQKSLKHEKAGTNA